MSDIMTAPKQFEGAEERLFQAGCKVAGLRYDGALDGVEGLPILLKSLDRSPLSPDGREFTWGVLANTVSARMWALTGWKNRPESLRRKLPRPVIIMGLPRGGTTALHKLLSVDPQFQGIEHWLTDFPSPRPPRDKWNEDARYRAIVHNLTSKQEMQPGLVTKHMEIAEDVDECLLVMKQTFSSDFFPECIQVPEYDAWWQAQDEAKVAFPWLTNVMRLVGVDDDRRWLLKNPGHAWGIDALFKELPDAKVIQTHRHPGKGLPSLCSLVSEMRKIAHGPNADLHALGRRDLQFWGDALKRALRAKEKSPGSFIDVWHDDFNARPMDVVRDIYKKIDAELTPTVEADMKARIALAPERRGDHSYTLEMFGLTPADISKTFGEYIEYFRLEDPKRGLA